MGWWTRLTPVPWMRTSRPPVEAPASRACGLIGDRSRRGDLARAMLAPDGPTVVEPAVRDHRFGGQGMPPARRSDERPVRKGGVTAGGPLRTRLSTAAMHGRALILRFGGACHRSGEWPPPAIRPPRPAPARWAVRWAKYASIRRSTERSPGGSESSFCLQASHFKPFPGAASDHFTRER